MKIAHFWKSCFNPRVLIGLGIVAAFIWYFFRDQLNITALLPFLFLLICPLSMIFMMKTMGGKSQCSMDHSKHEPKEGQNSENKKIEL